MLLRSSRNPLVLLFLLCALHAQARASNDGKLCEGLLFLLCAPIMVGVAVADGVDKLVTPPDPLEKLDIESVKRSLAKASPDRREQLLSRVVSRYLYNKDDGATYFDIIRHTLEQDMVSVRGAVGTKYLQSTLEQNGGELTPEQFQARATSLIKILTEHGATAADVELGQCGWCRLNHEVLSYLVVKGADPNRVAPRGQALLNALVERGQLKTAHHMVSLGADPNGRVSRGPGMLEKLAGRCDLKSIRAFSRAENVDRDWNACITASKELAIRLIFMGADPNGKSPQLSNCMTPYQIARQQENHVLADQLLKFGASPDAPASCTPVVAG